MADPPRDGSLNWRLSAHPITLCVFIAFRLSSLLLYLLGMWFSSNFVLILILTTLLLSFDFYYLKNIAGRRLVGLRWWNEASTSTWVFESPSPDRVVTKTDSRFFWLLLYAQPVMWVLLAVVAVVKLEFIWLSLVVVALILGCTNGVAFSRADRFSEAGSWAGGIMGGGGGFARKLVGRFVFR